MSRQRRSRFNAISAEQGNGLRDQAMGMMDAASSRENAAAAEAQQSIEQRAAAAQANRNEQAAQEGLRQRDIRVDHGPAGGAPDTPAFRPNRGTVKPSGGGDGLYNGLVEKVAARRKPRDQRRSLFSART